MGTETDAVAAAYFADMANHPVLRATEERELAEKIVGLECALWLTALSCSELQRPLIKWVRDQLLKSDNIDDVLQAFDEAVKSVGKKKKWPQLCKRFATVARLDDTDRKWMNGLVNQVLDHGSSSREIADTKAELKRTRRQLEQAKNKFVQRNLRLVVSIAKRHRRPKQCELLDIIQDGNLGLIKAVEKFDPSLGYRFSTYGSWWIRHAISRAVADKGRTVRFPVHILETAAAVQKFSRGFHSSHGRDPSDEEIADGTGLAIDKVSRVTAMYTGQAFSLDVDVGGEESSQTHLDFLSDDRPLQIDELASHEWEGEVKRLLSVLTPIEASIVRWRFGINEEELTLQEIGDKFHLSRERIRQLQEQAIAKIRKRLHSRNLDAQSLI